LVKTDPAEILNAVREDQLGIGYLPKKYIGNGMEFQIIYIIQDDQE
jgi:hypothetical protein